MEGSIESAFEELDQIMAKLEEGELSLEESFSLYQKGMALVKLCNEKIDHVEKQLIVLHEGEENGDPDQ